MFFEIAEVDGVGGAVEGIDRQREADVREMDADLVGFSGFGEAAEESETAETLFDPPIRARGSAGVFDDGHALGIGGMRREGGVDDAFIFQRPAADEGEVFFLDRVVLELVGEVLLGGSIECEEEDAGGVLVEAMDDADARVFAAGGGDVQLAAELFEDGIGFGAAGDGGEISGFVDGDGGGMTPEDFKGLRQGFV